MRLQNAIKTSVLQIPAALIKIISEMFHLKHRQSNKRGYMFIILSITMWVKSLKLKKKYLEWIVLPFFPK